MASKDVKVEDNALVDDGDYIAEFINDELKDGQSGKYRRWIFSIISGDDTEDFNGSQVSVLSPDRIAPGLKGGRILAGLIGAPELTDEHVGEGFDLNDYVGAHYHIKVTHKETKSGGSINDIDVASIMRTKTDEKAAKGKGKSSQRRVATEYDLSETQVVEMASALATFLDMAEEVPVKGLADQKGLAKPWGKILGVNPKEKALSAILSAAQVKEVIDLCIDEFEAVVYDKKAKTIKVED